MTKNKINIIKEKWKEKGWKKMPKTMEFRYCLTAEKTLANK